MVQDIKIADFDYPLPDDRIARHPLAQRDACRLIVSGADGEISHRRFRDLPELVEPGTLMVCNETKVINARMQFHRATGARIEVFLLGPIEPEDYVLTFQTRGRCVWNCMVGNLKKWKEDVLEKRLDIPGAGVVTLRARRLEAMPGNSHAVEFTWDNPEVTFASVVEAAGYIPIPPYLQRESEAVDATDYQTVYSRVSGSVAAPTAGLHFTPEVFRALEARGVSVDKVTLHVGAGTFQPVKSEAIGDHPMHTETFSVERAVVADVRDAVASGRHVLAVGTTSVRTLESLPVLGAMLLAGDTSMHVGQWNAYSPEFLAADTVKCLDRLIEYIDAAGDGALTASTAIMIAPGFRWRIVDRMVTNFHQPQSTLLLLVSSFLDGAADPRSPRLQWKRLYREALRKDYRFLSYGDACLLRPRRGGVSLPGSKSISARALVASFLGGGGCSLEGLSDCDDTVAMRRVLRAVADSVSTGNRVTVDAGEGAATLRFALAAAAAVPGADVVMTGSRRLMERPIMPLAETLLGTGADVAETCTEDGRRAWHVRGRRLPGADVDFTGADSSQFASAILLSAPCREGVTRVRVGAGSVSRPYFSMTAAVMRAMGAQLAEDEAGCVTVQPGGYRLPETYSVEPDWSGAAFIYEACALLRRAGAAPGVELPSEGAATGSVQGDAAVPRLFASIDAAAAGGGEWREDLSATPDLVPALMATACALGVRFAVGGVAHLRLKECDRLAALVGILRDFGYAVEECADGLSWDGSRLAPAGEVTVDPCGDHRMAMSFAPFAAVAGSVRVLDAKCVAKSFPGFWGMLAALGFTVVIEEDGSALVSFGLSEAGKGVWS